MYPKIKPYEIKMLKVDSLQGEDIRIYVESSGNTDGVLVIYLHGGPGDCSHPNVRQLYNPKVYNIVLFDQRGCGKSKPRGHLEKNTTQHLIEDIDAIRKYKGYEKMIVTGGSWGSSLALLYAQKYPQHVCGLILRGVYDLGQDAVVDDMFPENYDEMNQLIHYKKGMDRNKLIYHFLTHTKSKTRKNRVMSILGDESPMYVKKQKPNPTRNNYQLAMIGALYEAHKYFLPKDVIYKNMYKIKHIPTMMVDGRFDIVTPPRIAYRISKMMDHCKLTFIDGTGHTVNEKEIAEELVKCSDKMYKLCKKCNK
jgi:proline iminopeptidase